METMTTYGHWEGNTVEDDNKSGYIVSFTEWKTKNLLPYPIPHKSAKNLNKAARIIFTVTLAWFKKTLRVWLSQLCFHSAIVPGKSCLWFCFSTKVPLRHILYQ